MPSRPKALGEVLKVATAYLAEKSAHEPRQTAELLAARLLRCRPLELCLKYDRVLTDEQLAAIRRGVKRAAAGEPIQYIIGETEFMGHVLKVDPRTLIPRPETEILVQTVLDCQEVWAANTEATLIADIGTGSGCIAISLALERQGARFVAVDMEPSALELAAENASVLGVLDRIRFGGPELSDCLEPDSLDGAVANLPYIPTPEWQKLPPHIREHEPRTALDGGPDGLSVIKDLASDLWIVLKPDGFVFLEIGEDQGASVVALLKESGFGNLDIKQDLAGRDRIVCAAKSST